MSSPAPDSTQCQTDDSSLRAGLMSGLVNQLSWEGPVHNYLILTGISEQPDLRKGILKIKRDFYHYRVDVYTNTHLCSNNMESKFCIR